MISKDPVTRFRGGNRCLGRGRKLAIIESGVYRVSVSIVAHLSDEVLEVFMKIAGGRSFVVAGFPGHVEEKLESFGILVGYGLGGGLLDLVLIENFLVALFLGVFLGGFDQVAEWPLLFGGRGIIQCHIGGEFLWGVGDDEIWTNGGFEVFLLEMVVTGTRLVAELGFDFEF